MSNLLVLIDSEWLCVLRHTQCKLFAPRTKILCAATWLDSEGWGVQIWTGGSGRKQQNILQSPTSPSEKSTCVYNPGCTHKMYWITTWKNLMWHLINLKPLQCFCWEPSLQKGCSLLQAPPLQSNDLFRYSVMLILRTWRFYLLHLTSREITNRCEHLCNRYPT